MLLFNKPTAISYISKSGDKIYPVVIDIKEGVKSSETLSFMTADSNTGILSVAFMEGETIYNIDGATVVCDIERPDGTDLSIGAVKVADGVVEVPLGVNGTSQPGVYMFDFKIVRPGSKTIGVPLVSYTVTQSINTDEIVTQDDRLPVLNDLIVKVQNATSASTQATNECNKATQNSITATNNSIQATNNVNNAMKSINNAIASGTVDLELKQVRTSLNGTLHPTANDRINQMETHLLEATATTVETESSFTTVDATSNGYFEGVKLEGKTLVNLADKTRYTPTIEGWKTNLGNMELYKANTTYTFMANVTTLADGVKLYIKGKELKNGHNIVTFTTNNTIDSISIYSVGTPGDFVVDNVLILEGDYITNPPSYFEGLMSVGQDVEEVSVESIDNGNLIDGSFVKGSIDPISGAIVSNSGGYNFVTKDIIPTIPGRVLRWKNIGGRGFRGGSNAHIAYYGRNGQYLYRKTGLNTLADISIPSECYGVRILIADVNLDTTTTADMYKIHVTMSSKDTNLNPVERDKKSLLYYNPTTETWEKPILREWDTIEKHSDGKYYYHKRSEERVLNGSEEIGLYPSSDSNDIMSFTIKIDNNSVSGCICDRFIHKQKSGTDANYENILNPNNNYLMIRINKTKLTTQDIQGFKQWLQNNQTTVVYQLLQEKIYECTNIDLMTYSGETNYIINSGAISPKSLLKVHNNISNVVKILQEKVSLLENTFIAGLKSVLSGDMYSLATILYPEDFEQNDNTEQDIMVIPE